VAPKSSSNSNDHFSKRGSHILTLELKNEADISNVFFPLKLSTVSSNIISEFVTFECRLISRTGIGIPVKSSINR